MVWIKVPHGRVRPGDEATIKNSARRMVARIIWQVLIGIDFNLLAQSGDFCNDWFQDSVAKVLIGSIYGYHVTSQYLQNNLQSTHKCNRK
jgi:hypothetical protein